MAALLATLKALVPVLEPLGEQGINQLFTQVVNPYVASLSDSNDMKLAAQCLAPGVQAFLIAEIKKIA